MNRKLPLSFEEQLRKDCPALFKLQEGWAAATPSPPGDTQGMPTKPGLGNSQTLPPPDISMVLRALEFATHGDKQAINDTILYLFKNIDLLRKIVKMAQESKMNRPL